MSALEQPVDAFLDAYGAAAGVKGVADFMVPYPDDVRVLMLERSGSTGGVQDAWRAMVADRFGSPGR